MYRYDEKEEGNEKEEVGERKRENLLSPSWNSCL
jgi:hypothetical protein